VFHGYRRRTRICDARHPCLHNTDSAAPPCRRRLDATIPTRAGGGPLGFTLASVADLHVRCRSSARSCPIIIARHEPKLISVFSAASRRDGGSDGDGIDRTVKQGLADDAAYLMINAQSQHRPGYGLAAPRPARALPRNGRQAQPWRPLKYAIHPVAGRMPGHNERVSGRTNVPLRRKFFGAWRTSPPNSRSRHVAYCHRRQRVTNPSLVTTRRRRSTHAGSATSTRPALACSSSARSAPATRPVSTTRCLTRTAPSSCSATSKRYGIKTSRQGHGHITDPALFSKLNNWKRPKSCLRWAQFCFSNRFQPRSTVEKEHRRSMCGYRRPRLGTNALAMVAARTM